MPRQMQLRKWSKTPRCSCPVLERCGTSCGLQQNTVMVLAVPDLEQRSQQQGSATRWPCLGQGLGQWQPQGQGKKHHPWESITPGPWTRGHAGPWEVTQAAAVSCAAGGDPAGFVAWTRKVQIALAEKAMSKSPLYIHISRVSVSIEVYDTTYHKMSRVL